MHLVEIETLTREDIEELVNNGQLSWWEKKKAKMAAAEAEAKAEDEKVEEVVAEVVEDEKPKE